MSDKTVVTVTVNGEEQEALIEPRLLLVHLIRESLHLTGTHIGCDTSSCGACTVLLDGQPINSCVALAADVQGSVTTIEGYSPADGSLTPLQEALVTAGDVQCGYCLPGMVLAGSAFIAEHPNATDDEVREGMCGNLCRCTAYGSLIEGIREASKR